MRHDNDFAAFVRGFSAEMSSAATPLPPRTLLTLLRSSGAVVDDQSSTAVVCAGATRVEPTSTLCLDFGAARRNQRDLQLAFDAAVARQHSVCVAFKLAQDICVVHPDQSIEGSCVAWRRAWDGAVVVSRRMFTS